MTPEHKHKLDMWIEEAIIGLNFCPFARGPWAAGRVHIQWSAATTAGAAFDDAVEAIETLLSTDAKTIQTTLVVYPNVLGSFDEFLNVSDGLNDLLDASGAIEWLQIATFHPVYHFDNEDPESVTQYTNRSPWPIIHLLRQDDLTQAIGEQDDRDDIPLHNIELLSKMGKARVEALWSTWMPSS